MFAMSTETIAHCGEVSQLTCGMPTIDSRALTTPDSLLSIQAHTDADTSSGSSHGTRKSARKVADSGNLRKKKTASASPIVNWNAMETNVKIAVLASAGANVLLWMTET
jgi:hypothetical protein